MKIRHLAFGILCCVITTTQAQKPQSSPDNQCNYAGTKALGTFIGQSNSTGPDTIYLCLGDSILIQHNGDAVLSGDPNPATPAGIGYAYYQCRPSVSGDNLQAIAAVPGPGDPCVLADPPPIAGLYVTQAVPNSGDTWFFNSGQLQTFFGLGQPIVIDFAPITIDYWALGAYESVFAGAAPGPCVHVNTQEAFSVVYLNAISASAIDNTFGNDCIGKFIEEGGYPEFNNTATYQLDISLSTDPSIKGLVHSPNIYNFHNAAIVFSVSTPGMYTVSLEDGISCGHQFTMDMSGCNPGDNIGLSVDSVAGVPGETICIPLRVTNFDIISGSLSVNWNPEILEYKQLGTLNSAIASFFNPNVFLNTTSVSLGQLGMVLLDVDNIGATISIADNDVLMELCFEVLDTNSACSSVFISSNPAPIAFEDDMGEPLAVKEIPGEGCSRPINSAVNNPVLQFSLLHPNPVAAGFDAQITVWAAQAETAHLLLRTAQGSVAKAISFPLASGENHLQFSTGGLPAGMYFVGMIGESGRANSFAKLLVR